MRDDFAPEVNARQVDHHGRYVPTCPNHGWRPSNLGERFVSADKGFSRVLRFVCCGYRLTEVVRSHHEAEKERTGRRRRESESSRLFRK